MTRGDDRRDRRDDRQDDRKNRRDDRRDGPGLGDDNIFMLDDDKDSVIPLSRATSVFEKYIQSTFAECAGTMVYTFIACLAVTTYDVQMMAFSEGLAICFLCAAFLTISGGLFNPALTFAMALSGGLNPVLALMYFGAQMLGGIIGAAFIKAVVLGDSYDSIKGGCNVYRGQVPYDMYDSNHQLDMTEGTAVVIEGLLCTAIFLSYLMSNLDKKSRNSSGPLAYGFSVLVSVMIAYNCSGASFNPARSFGAAVVSGYWAEQYIWWSGSFLGGLMAGLIYRLLMAERRARFILRH